MILDNPRSTSCPKQLDIAPTLKILKSIAKDLNDYRKIIEKN
jgi:hypothetical protein